MLAVPIAARRASRVAERRIRAAVTSHATPGASATRPHEHGRRPAGLVQLGSAGQILAVSSAARHASRAAERRIRAVTSRARCADGLRTAADGALRHSTI